MSAPPWKVMLPSAVALGMAVSVGMWVGRATSASAQKLDKWVFDAYVSKARQQYLIDSVNNAHAWQQVTGQWEEDRRFYRRVLCKLYKECDQ